MILGLSSRSVFIRVDIQMTATCEYSDINLPANSWMEFEGLEMTSCCYNPFLQIWKGGIRPLYESKDDIVILAELGAKLGEILKDKLTTDS